MQTKPHGLNLKNALMLNGLSEDFMLKEDILNEAFCKFSIAI